MRREHTSLEREVEKLRAERRSADRKLREMRAEMLHEREAKTRTAGYAAAIPASAPAAPAEEARSVTISNLAGDARIIDVLDDGTEIVYEGDAARGTAATLSGDALAQAPKGTAAISVAAERPRPRPVAPVEPAAPGKVPVVSVAASLPKVSAVAPSAAPSPSPSPSAPVTQAPSRAWPADASSLYQEALAELRQGQHATAIEGLTRLIAKHPAHEFADNAQYWIGEAYYDRRRFDEALVAFQTTIARYPKGNKSADATLKAGLCLVNLGQTERGGEYLRRVLSLYPTSDSARIASERLARLPSVSTSAPSAKPADDRSPSDTSVRNP